MTDVTAEVRAHLRNHFAGAGISAEPDVATVTFIGVPPVEVLRFGPDPDGVIHYVSVGGSCHAGEGDPTEVVVSLRGGDFTFECGQDLSIGYQSHDAEAVQLYIEESFSFHAATPEAAVALRP